MLTRADKKAEAYREDARLIAVVSEEFEELLDIIEAEGNAAAFIESRRPVADQYRPQDQLPDTDYDRVDAYYERRPYAEGEEQSGACEGAGVVFSSVGASILPALGAGWRSYSAVDVTANKNLLEAARAAGVGRFVYVSVCGAPRFPKIAYLNAHERVVGLAGEIVEPAGEQVGPGEVAAGLVGRPLGPQQPGEHV